MIPLRAPTLHLCAAAALALGPAALGAQGATLTASVAGRTVDLSAGSVPARIVRGGRQLAPLLPWRAAQPGLEVAFLPLRAGALGIAVEAVVVRVDPARFRFALQHRVQANGMTGTWTIDSAGPGAALAMNAGQFKESGPWGWLVIDGYEHRNPLRAPLGIGIRIDTAGRLRWVAPGDEGRWRRDPATVFAFQSFPFLFFDRRVPPALRRPSGVDLDHRDARLVMAEQDDGTLLFVLTRYAALGTVAERVPVGLTTPETIALVAALGARHAVMLDGGTSAQLLVRGPADDETGWRGLRRVPLGLVAEPSARH